MRILMTILLGIILSGCSSLEKADDNYAKNIADTNSLRAECIDNDKHKVKLTDSGGQPIELEFAAGNCDQISNPKNGLESYADVGRSIANVTGTVLGAVIAGEYGKDIARIEADAEVSVAETNADVAIAEEETKQAQIESNETLIELALGAGAAEDSDTEVEADE